MSNKFSRLQNDSDRLQTHLQIDDEKNKAEITYTQDIAAVLESNKIEREEYSHQTSHNDMQKVASPQTMHIYEPAAADYEFNYIQRASKLYSGLVKQNRPNLADKRFYSYHRKSNVPRA